MPLRKPYQTPIAVIVRIFGRKCKGKNVFRASNSGFSSRDKQASTFFKKFQLTKTQTATFSQLYLNPPMADRLTTLSPPYPHLTQSIRRWRTGHINLIQPNLPNQPIQPIQPIQPNPTDST